MWKDGWIAETLEEAAMDWRNRVLSPLTPEQEQRIVEHDERHEHAYEPAFDDSGACLWCLDDSVTWVP